jgi:hypothetical protein
LLSTAVQLGVGSYGSLAEFIGKHDPGIAGHPGR